MHLYFVCRGNKMWQDQFIKELEGQYLPMKLKINQQTGQIDPNGVDTMVQFQLGVRPVQLYEIAFPEEHKDLILNSILGKEGNRPMYKKFEKWFGILRKVIGLEPIPKDYKTNMILPITRQHIDCIGVGLKKDEATAWGEGI